MKNKQNWSMLETVFLVMIIVPNLTHDKPIDAAHARASALFRLGTMLVGLIGIAAVQILKNRTTTSEALTAYPFPFAPAQDQRAISVTYNSDRAANWRCNLYVLGHHRPTLLVLGFFALISSFLVTESLFKSSGALAIAAFPLILALTLTAWFGFLCFVIWLTILQRLPTPNSVRMCTSRLTAAGFQDVTPDKTGLIEWQYITEIRVHQGDIYIWTKGSSGNFIPRTAFQDMEAARNFHLAAITLWKSNGTLWPDNLHSDSSVGPVG